MSEITKKKVLFVITKSNFGGAQRYVFDLATSLSRTDFDVVVAFGEGGELESKLNVAGVRTIKISALQRDVNIFKDFAVFFELLRIFKKERPQVVHLNSTKIGGVGAVAGRFYGMFGGASSGAPKIIFTAHGWAFNEKRNAVSRIAITFLQWLTVMLCHTTIAVSQKTAEQILTFPFVKREKIKVIYNGTANVEFTEREEARRALFGGLVTTQQAGASTHPTWIGTISELHNNKGLDIALNAFAKIAGKYPHTIFVAIGSGEEKANLEKQIAELNLTDRAFLLGFITDAKKYLKAFDIFTLTSRTEALPYAIIEAGLAQLPAIASAVGGIPEIINSPETGILVAINAIENKGKKMSEEKISQNIANALEKLLNNPELAKTLGQNLHNRVTSEFSIEKMHSQTFVLY